MNKVSSLEFYICFLISSLGIPCSKYGFIKVKLFGIEWVIDGCLYASSLVKVALNIFIDWWCSGSFCNIEAFISIVSNNSSLTDKDNDN